mgnify:CR=1 FL=1
MNTTPPTDVTDASPEEVAPAAPLIPPAVDRIEIHRDHYRNDDTPRWYVNIKAGVWSAAYNVAEADLFTSMNHLTAHMEKK